MSKASLMQRSSVVQLLPVLIWALSVGCSAAAQDTCPAGRKAAAGRGVALLQKALKRKPGRPQGAQESERGLRAAELLDAAKTHAEPDAPEEAIALLDVDALLLNEALAAEASDGSALAADLEKQITGQAGVDVTTALEVINAVSLHEPVEDAAGDGLMASADLIANLTGVHGEENCTECFEGDIRPVDESQLRLFQDLKARGEAFAGTLWREGKVDYCYAADINTRIRDLMEEAFAAVRRAVPCLIFTNVGNPGLFPSTADAGVKRCGAAGAALAPAVFIESRAGSCSSYLGMVTEALLYRNGLRAQTLNMAFPGCYSLGIGIHEIMHALGVDHEQNRIDRNKHVSIHWQNIAAGKDAQFDKNDRAFVDLSYDYLSVMHYSKTAFSKNDLPTILTSGGAHDREIGQRVGLSQGDANQLAAMYDQENSHCVAERLWGNTRGCTDTGSVDCSSLATTGNTCANQEAKTHCCGCGGGIEYRCWEGGSTCRRVPRYHGCLVNYEHIYGRYGCVIRNVCSFTVGLKCKEQWQKKTAFGPGNFWISPFRQLCSDPDQCISWKQ